MSGRFGQVRQVGHVVADVRESMQLMLDVFGIGPFFVVPEYPIVNFEFMGAPSSPVVSFAVAYSGSVQIELIQPLDGTQSLYQELLQQGSSGPHYVTYWVQDLSAAVAESVSLGARVVQSGGTEGAGRFAYLRRDGAPLFELLETTSFIEAWYDGMRIAAAGWDGKDPIRPAMP